MVFHLITLFPEAIKRYFDSSILRRAQEKKLVKIKFYNPRDFAKDKHKKARPTERRQSFGRVDDKPFGGGPGMVMKAEPIAKAISSAISNFQFPISKKFPKSKFQKDRTKIILLTPTGKQFTQKMAQDFAKKHENIILISGHYEGIDARLKSVLRVTGYALQELSIGPFVLTGGELAAGVVVDAVSRHIPGVLGKTESLEEKRGTIGTPAYTRPEVFKWRGKKYKVPKILLSGNHKKIEEWRKKQAK